MTEQRGQATSTELQWPLDDTTMYGTLVRPAGHGPFPGVVFVAGSGPTDRDWTTPLIPGTNGSARLLAEQLADRGFASLRYDKRASGPHVMENMPQLIGKISMQSHVDELTSAVRELAQQDYVDASRIFALTNSEGALHALNYQVGGPATPFAGLVLTAPPGRVMSDVGRSQIAAQLSLLPAGERLLTAYDSAIQQFSAGEDVQIDPSLPQGAQMLLQGLSAPANLPFARELWMADAASLLAQVRVPVLVLIGKKDIQVHWQADGARLAQAVSGREDVQFVFPEHANHVLKHEPRPLEQIAPGEAALGYNAPDAVLDPETAAAILAWLEHHR
jgi:alpha-beta hydrolase superfamily lysophospholipase